MSMHQRVSSVWKEITDFELNDTSVWKAIEEGWERVSGVWKQFFSKGAVPVDLIAFATDSADIGDWLKMNGSEASPDLIGKYPRADSVEGTTGGALTHTHGAFSTLSGQSAYRDGGSLPNAGLFNCSYPHKHNIAHTHDEENHEPEYLKVLPVSEGSSILTSMFLFYDGVSAPTDWSELSSALDKYYKGDTTPETDSTGGNATHAHPHTGSTSSADSANLTSSGANLVTNYGYHTHTMNHTHGGFSNDSTYYTLLPVSPDASVKVIPSGICGFFKGSTVPDGWSVFSVADEHLIKGGATPGSTPITDNHTHGTFTGSTGIRAYNIVIAGAIQSGYFATLSNHFHTMNHVHASDSILPPFQELMFLKKD